MVCRFIIKNRSMIPPNIWQHIEITLFSVNKCAVIPYKHRHPKLRSPICSCLQIVKYTKSHFHRCYKLYNLLSAFLGRIDWKIG